LLNSFSPCRTLSSDKMSNVSKITRSLFKISTICLEKPQRGVSGEPCFLSHKNKW
jgi:hypothetical protein